jgi:ketosteroid isomerase-like protein
MAQENVEVVRRFIDRYSVSPDAPRQFVADFWEPDGDYYPVRKFPEARPCHGVEEIARFLAEYRDAWDRYEFAVEKLIPIADDRVLVHSAVRAEGRESGVELDGDLYHCIWLRHGHFFRWEDHLSLSGALRALGLGGETLEAAGLWESAMSQENVEIVRRADDAFLAGLARGDFTGGFATGLVSEDHELIVVAEFPGPRSYRGREGLVEFVRRWTEDFERFSIQREELIDAGNGRVFASHKQSAIGKGSGVPMEVEYFSVFEVENGKLVRIRHYLDRDEALEAAGLRE